MSLSLKRSLILLIALILAYAPVIFTSSPVDPDSQLIIPHLTSMSGVGEYFSKLFSLQTIDVQPIRDLSLYLDILIFDLTGFNSLVSINLLLWFASCLVVFKILKSLFPEIDENKLGLFVLAFALCPLFTQSVAWGMARKHILAFFFISLATLFWIREKKISLLFYLLSIFSQPITVLWPLWAFSLRPNLKKFAPLFVTMTIVIGINYFYYNYSPTMLATYGSKTDEVANAPEMLLAFGHYFFQLIFPYLLSTNYELGHWSSLAGLFLAVLFVAVVLKTTKAKRFTLTFLLFVIHPLIIVLSKPSFLYDTYLLVPALGIFILVVGTWKDYLIKIPTSVLIAICFVWGGWSLFESSGWRDETKMTARSFTRQPGCKSAFQHIRSAYENGERPNPESRKYLQAYDCSVMKVSAQHIVNIAASVAYYEDDGTAESRLNILKSIADKGLYPQLVLAAYYLKINQAENASDALRVASARWGSIRFKNEYIPLANLVLKPFCEKNANTECLQLLAPFATKPKSLSYK